MQALQQRVPGPRPTSRFLLADQEGDRSQSGGDPEVRIGDGTTAAVVQARSSTEHLLITRGLQLSVLQDF